MDVHRSSGSIESLPLAKWIKDSSNKKAFSIATFNQQLDEILGGGVECGYVTEIFGAKGTGKTTLCYQLCIDVQIPVVMQGLASEAIYIETEDAFSSGRFKCMATACARQCALLMKDRSQITSESLQRGVHVIPCHTLEDLRIIILELDDYIARHDKIKLVVIDSMSFLYYAPSLSKARGSRATTMYFFAQELYRLINKYRIAIVVTCNMTSRFRPDGQKYESTYFGDAWTPIPHIRLELSNKENKRLAKLRKTYGVLDPENCTAHYCISSDGFR